MKKVVIAAVIVLSACGSKADKQQQAADSTSAVAAANPAGPAHDSITGTGDKFDAATAHTGDRVGTLVLASTSVEPAPKTEAGVKGSIGYRGELQLAGNYRAHYEYPVKNEACFWPDAGEWSKIPRVKGDSRAVWFCFSNKDVAIAQLGALGTQTHALIVIDDYTSNIATNDVWDTARLVRVVSKGRN